MIQPIYITAISSISSLGISSKEVWSNYKKAQHFFEQQEFDNNQEWIATLNQNGKNEIDVLRNSDSKYKKLDDSVLLAIYASRQAVKEAGWNSKDNFGINIGSSRGATALFESYHSEYLKTKKASTLTSPTTTLGNISSWIAHDLNSEGPEISHSITCSTALHAMLNGIAWLQSGMADKFIVGGSESPLTPFTLAQMKALKIYAPVKLSAVEAQSDKDVSHFPCQALNLNKKQNTMVLGEGAAVACLEKGFPDNALAQIEGIGYATEVLKHNISISSDAECLQRSMKMALGNRSPDEIDVIVMHAPGTIKGDISEHKAIEEVFGDSLPAVTSNKWQTGHTFGASGMLSIELALLMLKHQEFIGVPYISYPSKPKKIHKVMVNAVGFGGNAVSILLKIPN
ncbi:MAG: beta-ketoacyl synthase N-terminal-like domain-containing protein [Maribacter sp.]